MVASRHVVPPQSNLRNSASPIPPQPSSINDGSSCRPKTYSRKTPATSDYLTPPLTPSSSLRSDSTDHESTDLNLPIADFKGLTLADSGPESNQHSRFLIIGNAPSDLSEDVIGQYFKSLSSPSVTTPRAWPTPSTTRRFSTKPIQNIFRRSPENRDFIVAFYDIRDAERAKRIIESRASKWLQDDGTKAVPSAQANGVTWEEALTCCLAESGHCAELLGTLSPAFMTRTEGTFFISVNDTSPTRDFSASRIRTRRHFAIPVRVRSVLEKYGDVKAFNRINEDKESSTQIFVAEYFDVRDADAAWGELEGHVVDNMKLSLFSRSSLRDNSLEVQKEPSSFSREREIGGEHAAEPKTPTATTYLSQATSNSAGIPFPVLNDVGSGGYYQEQTYPQQGLTIFTQSILLTAAAHRLRSTTITSSLQDSTEGAAPITCYSTLLAVVLIRRCLMRIITESIACMTTSKKSAIVPA
ncbi:uncharacterized protein EDB91DRAFT_586770 [Suillus paluster]|uniref:uncharacterized protein n=1 Tax=Suillus paluster TaxID=48578 RepID=UPI001B885A19|nr:uncharacterized protein EDB91DRAFT_586770 [Suillus paluster]KAG1734755.1 hypothetical protein EDB91DRAFT_586770 [Suillus paluster]